MSHGQDFLRMEDCSDATPAAKYEARCPARPHLAVHRRHSAQEPRSRRHHRHLHKWPRPAAVRSACDDGAAVQWLCEHAPIFAQDLASNRTAASANFAARRVEIMSGPLVICGPSVASTSHQNRHPLKSLVGAGRFELPTSCSRIKPSSYFSININAPRCIVFLLFSLCLRQSVRQPSAVLMRRRRCNCFGSVPYAPRSMSRVTSITDAQIAQSPGRRCASPAMTSRP